MTAGYSPAVVELTPRMRAVLRSAAHGATVQTSALELGISAATVKTIRAAACSRLGASNLVAAVATAIERGDL